MLQSILTCSMSKELFKDFQNKKTLIKWHQLKKTLNLSSFLTEAESKFLQLPALLFIAVELRTKDLNGPTGLKVQHCYKHTLLLSGQNTRLCYREHRCGEFT